MGSPCQSRKIVRAWLKLRSDLDNGFYTLLELKPVHYKRAREWISRFETPLRTLDALDLAIAAENDLCLVTSDAGLTISAETFGIKVQILRPPIEG